MSIYSWLKTRLRPAKQTQAGCCLVCDSTDLHLLGPNAYRCLSCGYEGGPGYAAYLDNQRRARITALEPVERQAFARQRLDAARNLANGADPDWARRNSAVSAANAAADLVLDAALSLAHQRGVDRQAEEDQEIVELVGQLLEAQRELDDAYLALDQQSQIVPIGRRIISPRVPNPRERISEAARDLLGELDRLERVYRGGG